MYYVPSYQHTKTTKTFKEITSHHHYYYSSYIVYKGNNATLYNKGKWHNISIAVICILSHNMCNFSFDKTKQEQIRQQEI